MPVAHSDSHPLFHQGETTYRVGLLSEYATGMLLRIDLWLDPGILADKKERGKFKHCPDSDRRPKAKSVLTDRGLDRS